MQAFRSVYESEARLFKQRFRTTFQRRLFLSSIFINVRIDCLNVNRANDLAQLFGKERACMQ
jgi:hypothetical protein